MLTTMTGWRVERSVTVTRTRTTGAPGSSMRSVTRGGRPATTVAGTLSSPTTGRWRDTRAVVTPYSLPPERASDGAWTVPPVGAFARPPAGADTPPGLLARASAAALQTSAQRRAAAATLRPGSIPPYRQEQASSQAMQWREPQACGGRLCVLEARDERVVGAREALRDRHRGAPAELALGE